MVSLKPAECREWFSRLTSCLGSLPDSYIVFDVETTGLNVDKDLITQVGFCRVNNRKAATYGGLILDWTKDRRIDPSWFEVRLRKCEEEMRASGKPCRVTYDRVISEGLEPTEVLRGYAALLREASNEGDELVGHNVWRFDIPILERHFKTYIDDAFSFPLDTVWDIGMLEKARQLDILPTNGMSRRNFFAQVDNCFGKGAYWSLDRACVPNYELTRKYDIDMSRVHDAGFDCFVCHLIFEEQRALTIPP